MCCIETTPSATLLIPVPQRRKRVGRVLRRKPLPPLTSPTWCCDPAFLWFTEAVHDGEFAQAEALIRDLRTPNVEHLGQTPLGVAVKALSIPLCKALLKAGAAPDFGGRPSLHALAGTCVKATPEVLTVASLLIAAGADVNATYDETTALYWAGCNGHAALVEMLIEGGADVNRTDYRGRGALWYAAQCGHLEVLATLLMHGADTTQVSTTGGPLHVTCKENKAEVITLLDVHRPRESWVSCRNVSVSAMLTVALYMSRVLRR